MLTSEIQIRDNDLVFNPSPTQEAFVMSDANIVMLVGPMGEGKCIRPDTPVLMHDGTVKPISDVSVGERLMGDDGTARKVLALGNGFGPMYRVVPNMGEPFECNGPHILSLKRTRTRKVRRGRPFVDELAGSIVNMTVEDYLSQSKTFKSIHKLYRVGVDFPAQCIPFDPYFLGVWLGDGDSHRSAVTTPDIEIVSYLSDVAAELGLGLTRTDYPDNKASNFHLSTGNIGGKANPVLDFLKNNNLIQNKHIPAAYKINSRENRLKLLAGLHDSDGYVNRNSLQFIFKSKVLSDDVAFLCRSLGFAAYVEKTTKKIKSLGFEGEYFQIGVSGHFDELNRYILISRKRVPSRKPFKDVLTTGIREIQSVGDGEYCGVVIDGNRLFCLGDFTVTHNTYAGVFGLIVHAQRCGRDIRAALIRDTHQNIKISTAPDIKEILGNFVTFKDDYKKMIIHSVPKVECDLFGIDDQAALSKLQGPQYACIWLEEPAPVVEKINAGLPRGVFDMAIARASRQKGTLLRVQVTQNPADEDHWTEEVFNKPRIYASDPVTGAEIIKTCFRIPARENKHLNPLSRAANIAAFQDDPGKLARYVEGRAAPVNQGSKVVSTYNPSVHFLQDVELPVIRDAVGVRFWDAYHHPSCIIGQLIPPHRLIIHDVCYGEQMGVRELIPNYVQPLLATSKYAGKIHTWRDIGDPSMNTPDQSTVNECAANVIQQMFGGNFEPGPTRWAARIDPAISAFNRNAINGLPLIQLSKTAYFLHRGLNGGWHWKTDNNGHIVGTEPVKNQFSHPGDALLYGIAIVFPFESALPYEKLRKISQKDRMARAMSYSPGEKRRIAGM